MFLGLLIEAIEQGAIGSLGIARKDIGDKISMDIFCSGCRFGSSGPGNWLSVFSMLE